MHRFFLWFIISFGFNTAFMTMAAAQTPQQDDKPALEIPQFDLPDIPDLDDDIFKPQITEPDSPPGDQEGGENSEQLRADEDIIPQGTEGTGFDTPDYSQLSATAEREARLTALFEKLKDETNPENANLIAEEIWVIWLESGSASVNLVLRRGSDAQSKSQNKKARRMFDYVTELSPDYAEGWARSSRLALEEENYSRALTEAARTLTLEPRHFYALWTLGNAFEQLGRQEDALEAYREANALYPELKAVKDRLAQLEDEVEGDVL